MKTRKPKFFVLWTESHESTEGVERKEFIQSFDKEAAAKECARGVFLRTTNVRVLKEIYRPEVV